jgi:predicted transcriptional regulator
MSHIQNRHDNLDVEILNEAKSTNIESLQQKVEFQKKLKTILDKRQIEEEKNSSNYNSIESDALYQVLKTDDKQDLLQKLSDRTMTQEEYIQLSEEYNVNQDVVEYEIE